MGSPGPSDIETGIDWNRMRPEAKALLGKVGTQWLFFFIEGSLEVKLPTIWTDEKGRGREKRKIRRK